MRDFRDQPIQEALDQAVGPYRPERTLRSRVARVIAIAVLALAAFGGFWFLLHYATSQTGKQGQARKPIAVQLLPPPGR